MLHEFVEKNFLKRQAKKEETENQIFEWYAVDRSKY